MKKKTDDYAIIQQFTKLITSFGELEKIPRDFGVGHLLFPSEIHMVEAIGDEPGIKVTELALKLGITKGAVPKMLQKLEKKGLIIRYQSNCNKKEVLLKLTIAGHTACAGHKKYHERFDKSIKLKLKTLNEEQKSFLLAVFKELDEYAGEMLKSEKK